MASFSAFNVDLTKLDLGRIETERVRTTLRDAAYVAVGFGVLGVQQAQVRRRELASSLQDHPLLRQAGLGKGQVDELVGALERRFGTVDERVDALEAKLDTLVSRTRTHLPDQAGAALGTAHAVAKAARSRVRSVLAA
jgi:hypothetical protein